MSLYRFRVMIDDASEALDKAEHSANILYQRNID